MSKSSAIVQIEAYVKRAAAGEVAHDLKHADRVRHWALQIARGEGYNDLEAVEAAALLHDIGLPSSSERSLHGQVGAEIAERFLRQCDLFAGHQLRGIVNAILEHNFRREASGELSIILRDADMIDMFGAIGIMRAFTSKATRPEYDPGKVKGNTWGMSIWQFEQRFDLGRDVGVTIVDQINFQISCYDNLRTKTAKALAKPLVDYMKSYVKQLESEIHAGRATQ